MRIISGYLKGRSITETHGHRTHPMSEKMRGAIFNALGDIDGLTVLDAYAGTGALGFEAISRGAKSAVMTDPDPGAYRSMSETVAALGLDEQVQPVRAFIIGWSRRNPSRLFDILIFDPPYNDVDIKTLLKVAKQHSKPGSILIFSLPPKVHLLLGESMYEVLSRKEYGDATLTFYRRA
jgi:16S rRNA (guanine966-N2)-methyltransferase